METSEILQISLLAIFTLVAYWHRDRVLCGLCGFVHVYYAFTHYTELTYVLAFLQVVFGVYCFIKIGEKRKKEG